jgi:hypothetical protein
MRLLKLSLLSAILIVFSMTANAQPRPGGGGGGNNPAPAGGGAPAGGLLTKITVEQMAQLFNAAGYKAQVITNNGSKMVQAVFWTPDIFGGALPATCEKDNSSCGAIRIFVNLGKSPVDQKWIEAWNDAWLYVHASRSSSGDLIFGWDVPLLTGVTAEYLQQAIKLFKVVVDQSTEFKPDRK